MNLNKKISVAKAIRSKVKCPLPDFLFAPLRNLIKEDEINRIYNLQNEVAGVKYAQLLLDEFAVQYEVLGEEKLDCLADKQLLFVSNHPLGGLDGILLSAWLGGRYGEKGIYVIVNDLLMQVQQFSDIFVPVNKHGRQSRTLSTSIEEKITKGLHGLTFPAGLCSRKQSNGLIKDPQWRSSFLRIARRHKLTIVPLFFDGKNSPLFYRVAYWRKRLKIPFNIEMPLLPREMFRGRGKKHKVFVGNPIFPDQIPVKSQLLKEFSLNVMEMTYNIPNFYKNL